MSVDSIQIERTLIGKFMNNPQEYYNNHSLVSGELFEDPLNRKIFNYISEELENGNKIDLISINETIKKKGENLTYDLAKMMHEESYMQTEALTCILILNEKKKKEQLMDMNLKISEMLRNGDDVFAVIDYVEQEVGRIGSVSKDGIVEVSEQLSGLLKSIEHKMNHEGLNGITTGFESLDKFTGGWQETDLVIVGGASSMGKTSLALAFAFNSAFYGKTPTCLFSYEMSSQQLLSRLVSSDSGIDNKWIMKGTLDQTELSKIHESVGRIERVPLYVDECSSSSLKHLLNRIRQYVITKKVKLFMVDYLQLVSNDKKGRSREQEVSEVARALKNIAKELNITIIALSQLNRGVGQRAESRPTIADLRESGEIEQAADVVVLVYRPEYYGITQDDKGNSTDGLAEIIFAKGRNIGTGVLGLKFQRELTKFHEIQE
jgi:replicative DNA helicase|tara:strand:- start:178 stop:1479 length:1302 start_codon:yes stop_codon:yes gene_type:complete